MTDIYTQFAKAFANVSAWVILRNGEYVAKVAIKYPRDGAGRLWAYVHWLGCDMVRGHAGGYGYDKGSAAVERAIRQHKENAIMPHKYASTDAAYRTCEDSGFVAALEDCGGYYWYQKLAQAGFTAIPAV